MCENIGKINGIIQFYVQQNAKAVKQGTGDQQSEGSGGKKRLPQVQDIDTHIKGYLQGSVNSNTKRQTLNVSIWLEDMRFLIVKVLIMERHSNQTELYFLNIFITEYGAVHIIYPKGL